MQCIAWQQQQHRKLAALLGHELMAFWVDAGYSRRRYVLAGVIFPSTMAPQPPKVCVGLCGLCGVSGRGVVSGSREVLGFCVQCCCCYFALLLLSAHEAVFCGLTNNKQWRAALLPSLRWLAVGQSGIRRLSGRAYCHAPLQTINALSGCLGALAAGAYVTVVRTSLHPAVCRPVAPSLVMLRREHLCAACVSLLHCAACTVCVHHQKAGGLAAAFGQCAVL